MTRFSSLLSASLVVIFITFIVNSSDATTQYVNDTVIIGRCANFSIHGGTAVSFNGAQTDVTSGDVGVAPGVSITGNPALGTGYSKQVDTTAAINCAADEGAAYLTLAGLSCTNKLAITDLSGLTLFPGVYCTTAGFFTLTATILSLDAQGDCNAQFIFQTATTLITSVATDVVLLNGARPKNIFWQVGTSVTLGGSSSFQGQILAKVAISLDPTATVVGRLFAQAGVTFASTNMVELP